MATNQSKRVKEVVYPIFQECTKLSKDEFWIKLFDDLSRAKCPKGVMIFNGIISSTYKRNGFSYNFKDEKLTPEKLMDELPTLLKKSVCIYSAKDISNNEDTINDANSEYLNIISINDWKKVKNKKMKENLITNFTIKMKKKYKLNINSTKKLYTLIKDSYDVYKTHKSDDFIMKNDKLHKIYDIEYNEELKCFENLRLESEEENKTKNKKSTNFLLNRWQNYVSVLIKEISKN